ncbi:hypothetical protein Tco_0225137, partial [Tanacetum coccineum]
MLLAQKLLLLVLKVNAAGIKVTTSERLQLLEEIAELQSLMEVIPDEEEVLVNVIPLATKPPSIVDWKIHKEGQTSDYQITRADGSSK